MYLWGNNHSFKYLRELLFTIMALVVCVIIECFLSFSAINSVQKDVCLSDYGDVTQSSFETVLGKAINDIDGKTLILPGGTFEVGDVLINNHNNFTIEGDSTVLKCGRILIKDCKKFDVANISFVGSPEKFAHFDIEGNCKTFKIHDCTLTSTPDSTGANTIYGMRIMCDLQNPYRSRFNSPRNFEIFRNKISNTKYDGILVYALSSDFKVHHNIVTNASCIGIESEGRFGGTHDTRPAKCHNARIYQNIIKDCGDWGILLIWTEGFEVYDNMCLNNCGCFLSIGSSDGAIMNNIFEGNNKGFEISQEFFKLSNGINNNISIRNNHIKGISRENGRGVVDFRHCENILFIENDIEPIYRQDSYMILVSSVKNVKILDNRFHGSESCDFILKSITTAPDPETNVPVPYMNNERVIIYNNIIK